jgi:membrane peptidoglycan carboxypeptidase
VGELLVGLVVIAVCLGLVVDTTVVVAGLWAKQRSEEFAALPAALDVKQVAERSVVLDAKGHTLAWFWESNRTSVPAARMSHAVRDAIVAVEDERFYDNPGIDLRATFRALMNNLRDGGHEGGSTITQQYVKNLLLSQAKSRAEQRAATAVNADRKLAEARYAVALTQRMSKDDILTGYLNIAYFGRGAYGVQAAAETFFSSTAARLTVPQAALLAGLVKSPSAFDPFTHPAAARARRSVVLDRMVATGALTEAQAEAAEKAPLGVRNGSMRAGCPQSRAGYFCDWVQRQLLADPALGRTSQEREQALMRGGLVIRTTLDPAVQRSTQRAVDRARGSRAALAAVVVEPGTGAVRAMAASVPFGLGRGKSSVNLPLGGSTGFQAGSTFKVFVLTQAVLKRYPLSLRMYAPQRYASRKFAPYNVVDGRATPYVVGNAADSESGVFTLEQATWHSVNTYYMQLEERTGFRAPATIAESMGVRRVGGGALHRVPSFTLGTNEVSPLAMAGAMATYAAHGRYCPPYAIEAVTRAEVTPRGSCEQVLPRPVADTVTRVLQGVVTKGTGVGARVPGDAAGKTGTVQDFSAAWYVGYTPRLAAAVWMGDPRGGYAHPLLDLTVGGQHYDHMYGGNVPASVWAALIAGSPGGNVGASFDLAAALRGRASSYTRRSGSTATQPPAESKPAPEPRPTCRIDKHGRCR